MWAPLPRPVSRIHATVLSGEELPEAEMGVDPVVLLVLSLMLLAGAG